MKPIDVEQLKQVVEVALRVRAWIETIYNGFNYTTKQGRPPREGVD